MAAFSHVTPDCYLWLYSLYLYLCFSLYASFSLSWPLSHFVSLSLFVCLAGSNDNITRGIRGLEIHTEPWGPWLRSPHVKGTGSQLLYNSNIIIYCLNFFPVTMEPFTVILFVISFTWTNKNIPTVVFSSSILQTLQFINFKFILSCPGAYYFVPFLLVGSQHDGCPTVAGDERER